MRKQKLCFYEHLNINWKIMMPTMCDLLPYVHKNLNNSRH